MKLHNFFRKFEEMEQEDKFDQIETPVEPTSLFVIFKQLQHVRSQQKYFQDREKHLLNLAELGFKQLENKDEK